MKTKRILTLSLLLMAGLAAGWMGCFPRNSFPEVGGDYNSEQAVVGNWRIQSIVQRDDEAIGKAFPVKAQTLDLTPLFPGSEKITVAFNADGAYSMQNPDSVAIAFLPASGTWMFQDKVGQPRRLSVVRAANDTVVVEFGTSYRPVDNKLSLRFSRRNSEGRAFTSYDFNFVRQ